VQYDLEYHYVSTNGITLHVVQSGPKDGPLVILLHGFPEFWYGWRRQIPALAEAGYRVWAPDQRGYNLSDKPASVVAYKMTALVADIVGPGNLARVGTSSFFSCLGHPRSCWASTNTN
jgi:pimeloyl-ACP methyl ester carboxylesterase